MSYVNYEVIERTGCITLSRPEKRNALNFEVVQQLKEAFKNAENDSNVKIVVLRSQGEVFCAGADLEYLQQLQQNSYEDNLKDSMNLMELYKLIYELKKVVIAQVNGHAIAGGAGLVSVCDFSFTVPTANFGYTEVKIGFIPAIVSVFLLKKIGEAKTKELLLSGHTISAIDAKHIGLVNFIEDSNKLENTVMEFAEKLAVSNSGMSMEFTKKLISQVQDLDLNQGLLFAAEMNAKARSTDDCKKGISSFLKKEKLSW